MLLQNRVPKSHLLGSSLVKSSNVMESDEHRHSPSLSHSPVFLSCILQDALHDHSPMLQRNPASTKDTVAIHNNKLIDNICEFILKFCVFKTKNQIILRKLYCVRINQVVVLSRSLLLLSFNLCTCYSSGKIFVSWN